MGGETYCGNVMATPVDVIATKLAGEISRFRGPRAVGIEPDGRVYVDSPASVVGADLVGVYRYAGLVALKAELVGDLEHEIATRKIKPAARARVTS